MPREVKQLNDEKRKTQEMIYRPRAHDLLIYSSKKHGNWRIQNKPLLYITRGTPNRLSDHWKVITPVP
jgi:hypothetical protein